MYRKHYATSGVHWDPRYSQVWHFWSAFRKSISDMPHKQLSILYKWMTHGENKHVPGTRPFLIPRNPPPLSKYPILLREKWSNCDSTSIKVAGGPAQPTLCSLSWVPFHKGILQSFWQLWTTMAASFTVPNTNVPHLAQNNLTLIITENSLQDGKVVKRILLTENIWQTSNMERIEAKETITAADQVRRTIRHCWAESES